jgi:hypothetical protein
MKCNGEEKFYDNNGVIDQGSGETFEMPEQRDTPKLVKYQDYYMKREGDLMMNFRWKKYILDAIIKCVRNFDGLIKNMKIDGDLIKKTILQEFISLSALFQPGPKKCGRKYLETLLIAEITLIFVNKLKPDTEANDKEEYITANFDNIILHHLFYTNDRVYDLVSTVLQKLYTEPNKESFEVLFQNIFYKLAQFQNLKLLEKLVIDTKLPPQIRLECIQNILSDILDMPYEQYNEELIKTLLSGTTTNQEYVGFKKYLISILNTKPHYKDYSKLFD